MNILEQKIQFTYKIADELQRQSSIDSSTVELEKVRDLVKSGGIRKKRMIEGVPDPQDKQKIEEMISKSNKKFVEKAKYLSLDVQEIKNTIHNYYNKNQILCDKSQMEKKLIENYKFFKNGVDTSRSLRYPGALLSDTKIKKNPQFLIRKNFKVNPISPINPLKTQKTSPHDISELETTSNIKISLFKMKIE